MRLNIFAESWRYVDYCPCDLHFAGYLEARAVRGKSIFHFGSGEHHLVGLRNALRQPQDRNEILAVTASPEEHARYLQLVVDDADLANSYKVLFTDIYTLSPRLLPDFDLVTLFHLCEYYDPERSAYARLDDAGLLHLFLSKLAPGGRLFFYTGSEGFHRTEPMVAELVDRGRIEPVEAYESLIVYGRSAEGAPG